MPTRARRCRRRPDSGPERRLCFTGLANNSPIFDSTLSQRRPGLGPRKTQTLERLFNVHVVVSTRLSSGPPECLRVERPPSSLCCESTSPAKSRARPPRRSSVLSGPAQWSWAARLASPRHQDLGASLSPVCRARARACGTARWSEKKGEPWKCARSYISARNGRARARARSLQWPQFHSCVTHEIAHGHCNGLAPRARAAPRPRELRAISRSADCGRERASERARRTGGSLFRAKIPLVSNGRRKPRKEESEEARDSRTIGQTDRRAGVRTDRRTDKHLNLDPAVGNDGGGGGGECSHRSAC